VNEPTTQITFPIKIHMKNILPVQREAFDMIKDKFTLVENLETEENYEIVSIYGAVISNMNQINDSIPIYNFIRGLFTEKCNHELIKGKRIFITRKHSEAQHGGVIKRFIWNEHELMLMLSKYNFEYIQLENYVHVDKVKLFMESEIIISTHSACLTYTLFSNKLSKIIEILNKTPIGGDNEYKSICTYLNLNYNKYTNISDEDYWNNFNINVEQFEKYLINIL
jgi:capsular polysaccharide biosynthesis protein